MKCEICGKKQMSGNKVSHSNIKTKKRQLPNLQTRRVWYEKEQRWVRLKLSTRALRTLRKKPLDKLAAQGRVDGFEVDCQRFPLHVLRAE